MMAATLQERLKLKQYQIDTWTTREQLCLASAVGRSGDQNWVAVSRTIRMLTTETGRPPDWYSTKNCALQYAKLLEQVDAPKRKRERGETITNETPGEIVTKTLGKQRIDELRGIVSEEQRGYKQLCIDVQQLESGQSDHSLEQLWEEMMREQEQEEEEERKRQQWLKERKEKIIAIQQALRQGLHKAPLPPSNKKQTLSTSHSGLLLQRTSSFSEASSDGVVDNQDIENMETNIDDVDLPNPGQTASLLSSLLSRSPSSGSVSAATTPTAGATASFSNLISATASATPVASPHLKQSVSLGSSQCDGSSASAALQNLFTSALSGMDTSHRDNPHKNTSSPCSGAPTLSRLLELPPTSSGQSLLPIDELCTSSRVREASSNNCKQPDGTNLALYGESCKKEQLFTADDCNTQNQVLKPEVKLDKAEVKVKSDDGEETLFGKVTVLHGSGVECCDGPISPIDDLKSIEDIDDTKVLHNKRENKCEDMEVDKLKETYNKTIECCEMEGKISFTATAKIEEKMEVVETDKEATDLAAVKQEQPDDTVLMIDHIDKINKSLIDDSKNNAPVVINVATTAAVPEEHVPKKRGRKKKNKDKQPIPTVTTSSFSNVVNKSNNQNQQSKNEESLKSIFGSNNSKSTGESSSKNEDAAKPPTEGKKEFDEDSSDDILSNFKGFEDSRSTYDEIEELRGKKNINKLEDLEQEYSRDSQISSEEDLGASRSGKFKMSMSDIGSVASPVISESAPSSPGDFRDEHESDKIQRTWKQSIKIVWNEIAAHKFASVFLKPITEDRAPGYHSIVYRPMDLHKIKRNIDFGITRTTTEFKRDLLLMFLNARMYNTANHNIYQMASKMFKDAVATIERVQMLDRVSDSPRKSLRRETRESSAKRSEDDSVVKRKKELLDDKASKKQRRTT